jgi:hypothetical protein
VLGESEQQVEGGAIEGARFGGALYLDERAAARLDDVHVHLGA